MTDVLHCKQDKESHHQTEQSHGFRQGKSQDGIREQLLLQRWVPASNNKRQCIHEKTKHISETEKYFQDSYENKPGIANDETAKHRPNSSSRSSYSDCSSPGTNKLGSGVNVPADSTGLEPPQCDLSERALWHNSNTALQRDKNT